MKLFELPDFLGEVVTREAYVCWLQHKAAAHVKHDRKRGNQSATVSEYKRTIHVGIITDMKRAPNELAC